MTESLESEMQKAFDSIKLNSQNSMHDLEDDAEQMESKVSIVHNGYSNQNHLQTSTMPNADYNSTQLDTANGISVSSLSDSADNKVTQSISNGAAVSQSNKQNLDRDEVRVMQKVLGNEVCYTF